MKWEVVKDSSSPDEHNPCPRLILHGPSTISWVAWQSKGDYLAVITPSAGNNTAVVVHQLSRAQTQCPFKKSPGEVQCAAFHPNKPILFLATKRHVRVYHLLKQVQEYYFEQVTCKQATPTHHLMKAEYRIYIYLCVCVCARVPYSNAVCCMCVLTWFYAIRFL